MYKKDFKFSCKFNCSFDVKRESDFGKYLSTANLSKLKTLMPSFVDLENNPDLTGVVLNAAVGNYCNKNGDAIDNKTLVAIAKNFLFKRVDIEHIETENVGVIVNYGFSNFKSGELMTDEEVSNSLEPVNLSLALVLWDTSINEELYDLIVNSSNPDSPEYQSISASWEVYYNDYDICMGKTKLVSDCKIIKAEDKSKYDNFIPKDGGLGRVDGNYLFRLMKYDENNLLLPAGIGLVENPAAEVKGLQVIKAKMSKANVEIEIEVEKEEKEEDEESEDESSDEKENEDGEENEDEKEKMEEDKAKCEQKMANLNNELEKSVNSVNNKQKLILLKNMTIKSFNELTDESLKTITASDIQKINQLLVEEAVKKASQDYEAKVNENKALAEKQKQTEEALNDTKTQLESISAKLKEFELKEATRVAEANFNARMDALDKEFELSDESRSIIAKDLTSIDSTEQFNSYKTKMAVFLKKKASTASTKTEETVVTAAVKTAETKVEVPNSGTVEEGYADKWKKAFAKENLTISLK